MNFSTVVRRCLPQAVIVMAPHPETLKKLQKNPDMEVPETMGIGSGFFLDTDGHVVTNYHVIAQGDVNHIYILCHDGRRLSARLVGGSPEADIAVLKIEPFRGITPVSYCKDSEVDFGQAVFAIGCPQGLEFSVSRGVVSHPHRIDRDRRNRYGDASILPVLQTDTAMNPGNSGGPLFNRKGELVGVNTFLIPAGVYTNKKKPKLLGRAVGSIGLGFAIKAEGAIRTAEKIVKRGGLLGWQDSGIFLARVSTEDILFCRDPKAVLKSVSEGSAAARAGFKAGDIITSICGVQTPTAAEAATQLFYHAGTGCECTFQVERPGLKNRKTLRMVVPEAESTDLFLTLPLWKPEELPEQKEARP